MGDGGQVTDHLAGQRLFQCRPEIQVGQFRVCIRIYFAAGHLVIATRIHGGWPSWSLPLAAVPRRLMSIAILVAGVLLPSVVYSQRFTMSGVTCAAAPWLAGPSPELP